MKKEIPHIKFNPSKENDLGFEIVSIEKIAQGSKEQDHNPEAAHQLKFYNLIFFTEGKGEHFVDFNLHPVQKNNLVYLAKEQINAFKFSPTLKGFCIVFTEEYLVKRLTHLPKDFIFRLFNPQLFFPVLELKEQSEFIDYFNLLKKEYDKSDVFNHKAILDSLFIILLSKAENLSQENTFEINDSSKMTIFQKFISMLANKFTEQRNAEYYAKELAISYKHLNTICKELVNKTAKSVITDFIILQAKRNLINSEIKSTELAYKLGFEDPTNFTKYFKKITGLTPNSFKKTYSKKL